MSESWQVETYAGGEGLRALEVHWDDLVAQMPERAWHHSFASHRAYFENLSSPGSFVALVLRDGAGDVRALCPFEERRRSIFGVPVRVWELPWDKHTRVRDVICPPGEARRALVPQLRSYLGRTPGAPHWIVLARVTERGAAWKCFEGLPEGTICTEAHGATDVVDTTLSAEVHDERRSRKFRANLRRAFRMLDELPDVRFTRAAEGEALVVEFERFLELEASGWKGDDGTGTAIRLDPPLKGYYGDMVANLSGVEIVSLYAEGNCLACVLCARSGSDFAILKVCYNEEYARMSPGKLLMEHVLQRCVQDDGISSFNLVSHWGWLQDWKPDVVPAYSVYLTADRWLGGVMLGALDARFRYGPLIKRWVAGVRGAESGDG